MLIFYVSYNSKIHLFPLQYIHLRIGINFLILDYINHMEHHLNQITNTN